MIFSMEPSESAMRSVGIRNPVITDPRGRYEPIYYWLVVSTRDRHYIFIDYTTLALNYRVLGGGGAGALYLTGGVAMFDVDAEFSTYDETNSDWETVAEETFYEDWRWSVLVTVTGSEMRLELRF